MLIESSDKGGERVQLVSHIPRPERDNSVPHVSPWQRIDGGLMRIIYAPARTDEDTIQALLWYDPDKAN